MVPAWFIQPISVATVLMPLMESRWIPRTMPTSPALLIRPIFPFFRIRPACSKITSPAPIPSISMPTPLSRKFPVAAAHHRCIPPIWAARILTPAGPLLWMQTIMSTLPASPPLPISRSLISPRTYCPIFPLSLTSMAQRTSPHALRLTRSLPNFRRLARTRRPFQAWCTPPSLAALIPTRQTESPLIRTAMPT